MSISGSSDELTRAAEIILAEGVALLPTDTVYGLAVRPDSPTAIDRLFAMKGRPREKNLPVMVGSGEQLSELGVDINEACSRCLASPYMPGPLTLAVGFVEDGRRPAWLAGRDEVAVRIPAHPAMLAILAQTGPLLVTSANISGGPTHENVPSILSSLLFEPDVTVDRGPLSRVPSTLVNCRKDPPVVERVGVVSETEILRMLNVDR
ncbi:L-threonylcarbamoyladenylate synthase [Micromonospora gifhornensis]|uniref:L-threonylcarbamoyladenylate synthase n=1 Tax=Micromonospora gifhornensis TaxID=84594 RepID=UPI0034536D2F